jgi:hypothetical protein
VPSSLAAELPAFALSVLVLDLLLPYRDHARREESALIICCEMLHNELAAAAFEIRVRLSPSKLPRLETLRQVSHGIAIPCLTEQQNVEADLFVSHATYAFRL